MELLHAHRFSGNAATGSGVLGPRCEVLSSGGPADGVRNVFLQASKALPEPPAGCLRRGGDPLVSLAAAQPPVRTLQIKKPTVSTNGALEMSGRASRPVLPASLHASLPAVTFSPELPSRCCDCAGKRRSLRVDAAWALRDERAVIYGANLPRLLPAQRDACLRAARPRLRFKC